MIQIQKIDCVDLRAGLDFDRLKGTMKFYYKENIFC